MSAVRVQCSIDDKLLERIDKFASDSGFTRSGMIAFACDQFMKAKEIEPALKITLDNLASSYEALVKKVDQINAKN